MLVWCVYVLALTCDAFGADAGEKAAARPPHSTGGAHDWVLLGLILGVETDVFGAEAYAYHAGRDAAEVGETLEQFEEPREG